MKRLNNKLLDVVGTILVTLLSDAQHEEHTGETMSEPFRLLYRGSSQGKKEFVKSVFQILKDKDVIGQDQLHEMNVGFYLDTATARWSELAYEILEDAKKEKQ